MLVVSVLLAAVTVAVLTSWAVAAGATVAAAVYTTLPPGARLAMVSLIAPETLVLPLPLQTYDVRPAGTGSLTATLVAVPGPLLLTVMV